MITVLSFTHYKNTQGKALSSSRLYGMCAVGVTLKQWCANPWPVSDILCSKSVCINRKEGNALSVHVSFMLGDAAIVRQNTDTTLQTNNKYGHSMFGKRPLLDCGCETRSIFKQWHGDTQAVNLTDMNGKRLCCFLSRHRSWKRAKESKRPKRIVASFAKQEVNCAADSSGWLYKLGQSSPAAQRDNK